MNCVKNEELCIKNEELCIKNEELCIKNDEFGSRGRSGSAIHAAFAPRARARGSEEWYRHAALSGKHTSNPHYNMILTGTSLKDWLWFQRSSRSGVTAMGAPVHETTITDLPDAVILRTLNMLGDVKAVRRCGAVCQKLKKLNRLVAATYFGVCHLGQANPAEKRRTLGDIVQGCLQHGVTTADFSDALAMGSRMMSQLGDPAVVGPKPGVAFHGPTSVPLIRLAQRLQHLTFALNQSPPHLGFQDRDASDRLLVVAGSETTSI